MESILQYQSKGILIAARMKSSIIPPNVGEMKASATVAATHHILGIKSKKENKAWETRLPYRYAPAE
jgi:hypothetical protein